MEQKKLKICVFVSGRGSNLKAMLDHPDLVKKAEIVLVVSDRIECKAFEIARMHKINYVSAAASEKEGYMPYNLLNESLISSGIDLIVLAGFLKKVPEIILQSFAWKIINIHPALLPLFGGKGMYGVNVHSAVWQSGMKVSGATVHFVNEEYDQGLIIAQRCVDISDCRNADEIAAKVLTAEHALLPETVCNFAEGCIAVNENRVFVNKN